MTESNHLILLSLLFILGYFTYEHQEVIKKLIHNLEIKDENKIVIILIVAFIVYSLYNLSKNKLFSENFDSSTNKSIDNNIWNNLQNILLSNTWESRQKFNNGIEVNNIKTNNVITDAITFSSGNLNTPIFIQTGSGLLENINNHGWKRQRVNFSVPFSETPIIITSGSGKDDNQDGGPISPVVVNAINHSKTGFDVTGFNPHHTQTAGNPKFSWIAIGKK